MGSQNGYAHRGCVLPPILEAACAYHADRGWAVTPLKGKVPFLEGWPKERLDPVSEPGLFAGATGVGVVLGLSGLVDLEADCLAAELALEALAPATGCIC